MNVSSIAQPRRAPVMLLIAAALLCALSSTARAQEVAPPKPTASLAPSLTPTDKPSTLLPVQIPDLVKKENLGGTVQLVALLTVLSLAPAILLMVTSFTR